VEGLWRTVGTEASLSPGSSVFLSVSFHECVLLIFIYVLSKQEDKRVKPEKFQKALLFQKSAPLGQEMSQ
jgi:hypothetical protein